MKWYFDELYNALFVVPVVKLAFAVGRFDKHSVEPGAAEAADRRIDPTSDRRRVERLWACCCWRLGLSDCVLSQTGLIRRGTSCYWS